MHPDHQARLYASLGLRIRDIRDRQELSQSALAEKVGISRASMVNIEKGRQNSPLHVLYDLADALGMDIRDLLPPITEVARREEPEVPASRRAAVEEVTQGNPEARDRILAFIKNLAIDKGDQPE